MLFRPLLGPHYEPFGPLMEPLMDPISPYILVCSHPGLKGRMAAGTKWGAHPGHPVARAQTPDGGLPIRAAIPWGQPHVGIPSGHGDQSIGIMAPSIL